MPKIINNVGYFGNQVTHYQKARRPYPPEIFSYLKNLLKGKRVLILDLGCGTGLSTRELAKIGNVVGCDYDPKMLDVAKGHKDLIPFVIGRANKLPFPNGIFDVVAAFSAFHWFDDKASVKEIKRVLKPGGVFFTGNHTADKNWSQDYRRVIMDSIKRPIANFRGKNYQPEKILTANGFKKVSKREFKEIQSYSLKEVLDYSQSISVWNSVPEKSRKQALEALKNYFIDMKKLTGKIERNLISTAVIGFK